MARRSKNRDLDFGMGIVQLIMVLVLPCMLFPGGRQILMAFGHVAFAIVILVGIVALLALLFRYQPLAKAIQSGAQTNPALKTGEDSSDPSAAPRTTEALIAQLRAIDWFQFKKVVGIAYRKLGYVVTRRGGANPDGGIDLLISKDGRTRAVQCKQWKSWNVGVKAVREFLGAMTDASVNSGVFVTLCGYTGDAKQLAEKHGIEMLNETGLAGILESVDAKYDPEILALLNAQRKFCPPV